MQHTGLCNIHWHQIFVVKMWSIYVYNWQVLYKLYKVILMSWKLWLFVWCNLSHIHDTCWVIQRTCTYCFVLKSVNHRGFITSISLGKCCILKCFRHACINISSCTLWGYSGVFLLYLCHPFAFDIGNYPFVHVYR